MRLPFGLGGVKHRTKTELTEEDVAALHHQRMRQALDDSSLLIAYAAESKSPTTPEMITALIDAKAAYAAGKTLDKAAEANFWNAYSKLATSAQPATVAGIRNNALNRDLGFFDWMIKYPWISVPATVALVLFIILQIYTVRGAHLLKQFASLNSAFTEAQQAVLLEDAAQTQAQEMAAQEQPPRVPAEVKRALIKVSLDRYRELLAEWNSCTLLSIFLFCPSVEVKPKVIGPTQTVIVDDNADGAFPHTSSIGLDPDVDLNAVRAEMRLNNLNASILPMILGLLGACTSVLRSISRRVIDQSMNTSFLPAYYVRIVLGMIIGATIGLFLLPSPDPNAENPFTFLTNLPLLTAAFLAGYAAEVFFALLDRIVGDARNYVAGSKEPPAK